MKKNLLIGLMCVAYTFLLYSQGAIGSAVASNNDVLIVEQVTDKDFEIDIQEKQKNIINLVKRAVVYFLKNTVEQSCDAFINDKNFVLGDAKIFVWNSKGVVYVQEDQVEDIWNDVLVFKNGHGIKVHQLFMNKAQKGGGWVDYEWHGGYKQSYVEQVVKDGMTYLIGAGWYPITKESACVNHVKSAVAYFNQHGREKAWAEFNNKSGSFIRGDLYISAYDYKGYNVSHGDNSALIGRNLWDFQDANGVLIVQNLITAAQKGGGFVPYLWKNVSKITYSEGVEDETGEYEINAGYYPGSSRTSVTALVRRAAKYFYAWGLDKAAAQFSLKTGPFVEGDLYIMMCDYTGKVIAHGDSAEFVGQNLLDLKNSRGRYIIKEMRDIAKAGGGWMTYNLKNALAVCYVEPVKDKQGEYFISSAFWPETHREIIEGLVTDAVNYLSNHTLADSLQEFKKTSGDFYRSGCSVFVFNASGDCYVYGSTHDMTWKNFKKFKDQDGKSIFKMMLNAAQKGSGWIKYKTRNAQRLSYVQGFKKDNEFYVIGSSFYK